MTSFPSIHSQSIDLPLSMHPVVRTALMIYAAHQNWARACTAFCVIFLPNLPLTKELARFLPTVVPYLATYDDGAHTLSGISPDLQMLPPTTWPA